MDAMQAPRQASSLPKALIIRWQAMLWRSVIILAIVVLTGLGMRAVKEDMLLILDFISSTHRDLTSHAGELSGTQVHL